MSLVPFPPGDPNRINVPKEFRRRPSAFDTQRRGFLVQIPARVGLSVKNMSTFGPGKAGGGGIGFATNIFSKTYVSVTFHETSEETVANYDVVSQHKRPCILRHHIAVFRECIKRIGIQVKFSVWTHHEEAFPAHCGLGSTSGAALGVLHGLNLCFDSPFTSDEIRHILACNYVEESHEIADMVNFGYETTMTAAGADGGGFYVIHEETLEVQARNNLAFQGYHVHIFSPDTNKPFENAEEASILAEGAEKDSNSEETERKNRIFNNILIPELSRGTACDVSIIGAAVVELQKSGGKRVEVMRHPSGFKVLAFMDMVLARAAESVTMVGMSSIGPTTVVISRSSSLEMVAMLDDIASKCGMKRDFLSSVNTTGLLAKEIQMPKLVAVVGKPYSGKSTLCTESGFNTFSAGACLRQWVAESGTTPVMQARARLFEDIMSKGEVRDRGHVSSTALLEELYSRICRAGYGDTWLLDGFPRSAEQVDAVCGLFGAPLAAVVTVVASDTTREERAAAGDRKVRGKTNEPGLASRDVHDETECIVAAAKSRNIRVLAINNDPPGTSVALERFVHELS